MRQKFRLKAFEDILDYSYSEMLVTWLLITMVMLTDHLMYCLPTHSKARHPRAPGGCSFLCPPGYYLSNCKCSPCPSGFFSRQENSDYSCHRCFQSCIPVFNMEVEKQCTNTSDVKCRCQDGFICTEQDLYTHHCLRCDPITTSSPTSSISTDHSFTHSQYTESWLGDEDGLFWILFGFILTMLSIIIVMVFLRLCKKKEKECFKQFVRKCSLGNLEMESETIPPPNSQPIQQPHDQDMQSHDGTPTNRNTDRSFHQPISSEQAVTPPDNLGPLHIYSPQTVFVSLLNQFGLDGGKKKTNELQEPTNNSNVHNSQSPPIHLSEEERNGENDFIYFPSQEQGKECHISKEEVP